MNRKIEEEGRIDGWMDGWRDDWSRGFDNGGSDPLSLVGH